MPNPRRMLGLTPIIRRSISYVSAIVGLALILGIATHQARNMCLSGRWVYQSIAMCVDNTRTRFRIDQMRIRTDLNRHLFRRTPPSSDHRRVYCGLIGKVHHIRCVNVPIYG